MSQGNEVPMIYSNRLSSNFNTNDLMKMTESCADTQPIMHPAQGKQHLASVTITGTSHAHVPHGCLGSDLVNSSIAQYT